MVDITEGRGVGTSANAALKIGVGARATGMGEASVAAVEDVSSIYWNPAGLIRVRETQLSAMHIEWLSDIRYEWVGFAQPLTSRAVVAADVSYLYVGSIPRTIESVSEGYEEDGTFAPSDIAGRVAFAARFFENLLVGGSFQRFQSKVSFNDVTKERIGDKTAQSMVIDFGCLYNIPMLPELNVGCCLQNMGKQTRAFIKEKEALPFAFNVGMAYKTLVATRKTEPSKEESKPPSRLSAGALVVAIDLNFPADSSASARMGAEYRFGNGISIRGGYRTGTGFEFPSGICGGIGYDSANYQVDYAFVPYGNVGNTHRISFTVRF